jgi:hypothetical protein
MKAMHAFEISHCFFCILIGLGAPIYLNIPRNKAGGSIEETTGAEPKCRMTANLGPIAASIASDKNKAFTCGNILQHSDYCAIFPSPT